MKALLLLLVSGVLTAAVFMIGKQAGQQALSPLIILFWQMSGAALVVWLVCWPTRNFPRWDLAHLRYYLIGGLLGVSLPYVLAFLVLRELPVGLVGLMTALSPLMTYAMARLLGIERAHPLRLLGLTLGLCGVAVLLMPAQLGDLQGERVFMLLALCIPLTLAASNIYRSRYWPAGSAAMPLVIGMLTVQSVALLIINLWLGNVDSALPASIDARWLLVLLATIAGASYLSSFSLLRVGGPVYLSQVGYVITLASLFAGVLIWDEHYDAGDLLSMGLIFCGVMLTTWSGRLQQTSKTFEQGAA